MKRLFASISAACLLLASTQAFAATDIGVVKSIDVKHDSITLDDGKVFNLVEKVEAEQMKVGTKVQVTYRTKSGKLLATSIQVVK